MLTRSVHVTPIIHWCYIHPSISTSENFAADQTWLFHARDWWTIWEIASVRIVKRNTYEFMKLGRASCVSGRWVWERHKSLDKMKGRKGQVINRAERQTQSGDTRLERQLMKQSDMKKSSAQERNNNVKRERDREKEAYQKNWTKEKWTYKFISTTKSTAATLLHSV